MKQNRAERQLTSAAAVTLACLVFGLIALAGCIRGSINTRIPDIPPIPGAVGSSITVLGYGTLTTTDRQKIVGWWRIEGNNNTYQRHEPPTTRSGRPTGFERTLEAIPEKRVVGFKRK